MKEKGRWGTQRSQSQQLIKSCGGNKKYDHIRWAKTETGRKFVFPGDSGDSLEKGFISISSGIILNSPGRHWEVNK